MRALRYLGRSFYLYGVTLLDMHSKEPWSVVDADGRISIVCGDTLAKMVFGPDAETAPANARRIVACVNICAGIGTEELEQQHDLVSAQLASEQADPAFPPPTLQTIPAEGLVWVCLNVEGMSSARANAAMVGMLGTLTKAREDGKTSAQFILTTSLWPGQIHALPDEELSRVGLVRDYVAKGLRDEALSALEGLVAKAECFGMGVSCDEYATAQAVIAKARGEA